MHTMIILVCPIYDDDDDDDDDDDEDEQFLWYGSLTKGVQPYFPSGALSERFSPFIIVLHIEQ